MDPQLVAASVGLGNVWDGLRCILMLVSTTTEPKGMSISLKHPEIHLHLPVTI